MTDESDIPELDIDIPMPKGLSITTDRMPYRILVVGNFAGSEKGSVSGPLAAGVTEITPDTFDEIMRVARPSVNFTTSDPLAGGGVMAEVALQFDSLRALDPANIVQQLPATRPLMQLREQLVARLRGKISPSQLADAASKATSANPALAWLTESLKWSPQQPAATPEAVSSVLDQIDLGEPDTGAPTPPATLTPVGERVAALAGQGSNIPAQEVSAIRRTLAEIDRRVNAWLTAVLHSPHIQSLESAWRSLAFLVAHTEFRKNIRVSAMHASRAELTQRLTTLLIDPVFDEGADSPDVIVADALFSNTAPDIETLDELAQHAGSLPALVLAGVSPAFFGVKHAWQIPTLPAMNNLFDQWQYAKWKTLRGQFYARSLGVVFGRGLLRTAQGHSGAGDLEFVYKEECNTDNDLVWASGAMAGACAITRSLADTGWPTAMAGFVHGRIEGFTTAEGGKKGEKKFGPSDVQMTQPKIEELAAAGLNAVLGSKDHDDVIFWNGLTAARPEKMSHDGFLEISLPYQLFAARLSVLLLAIKPQLSGLAPEKIVETVTQHVRHWLKIEAEPTAEQLSVLCRPLEDDPSTLQLAVTVTPPSNILPGSIPVVLGYRIR